MGAASPACLQHASTAFVIALRLQPRTSASGSISSSSRRRRRSSSRKARSSRSASLCLEMSGPEPMVEESSAEMDAVMKKIVDSSSSNSSHQSKEGKVMYDPTLWATPLDHQRQVFCNRALNMRSIQAVGFDMDYTLAVYDPDTFETMTYNETVKKLVENLGYPRSMLDWKFDPNYMVRGLAIDKARGNLLKMDRHKYVKIAYHGFREISKEEKIKIYGATPTRESFDEPRYVLIDTLFSLCEAYLFAQLVEYKDQHPEEFGEGGYDKLYSDTRAAVDLCHRDGTLKTAVAADPQKYIRYDPDLMRLFKLLREAGKKVFIVTNSLWDYTNVVMEYLCDTPDWLSYFDVVISGSSKPSFFRLDRPNPIFEIHTPTGMLMNTDNGSPMVRIGSVENDLEEDFYSQKGKVFQGGGFQHLHAMLNIQSGSEVLYVGDHIYGDVLKSKKTIGWRTVLIVPELDHEMDVLKNCTITPENLAELRAERDTLDDQAQRMSWFLKSVNEGSVEMDEEEKEKIVQRINELRELCTKASENHSTKIKERHAMFHKIWGQLFKAGYQNSRFAHQVERFACLYTSKASNLLYYSPNKSYRTSADVMPHDI